MVSFHEGRTNIGRGPLGEITWEVEGFSAPLEKQIAADGWNAKATLAG